METDRSIARQRKRNSLTEKETGDTQTGNKNTDRLTDKQRQTERDRQTARKREKRKIKFTSLTSEN